MAQGELVTPNAQTETGYDFDPVMLNAIATDYSFKKSGLVYDKIFTPINTRGACEVMGFDFTKSLDTAGVETNMSALHALEDPSIAPATCYSEAPEIQAPKFARRHYDVKDYRLKILLSECCAHLCGVSDEDYERMIREGKVASLLNRYLISKEVAGFNLLTGGGVGAWTAGWEDGDISKLADSCFDDSENSDGKAYDMAGKDLCDPTATDLLKIIENIQALAYETGHRNVLITNRHFLMALKRSESLKPSGCIIPQRADDQALKSLLGVSEIYVADAMYNSAGFGNPLTLGPIWQKGFALLFQKADLFSLDQAEGVGNFAVDLRKYDPFFRTFPELEKGANGVDWLSYQYSYTPHITNIKAGTLLYNIGA